jgi:hypothetical protein
MGGMSTTALTLYAALLGVGGSVLGGIVGGWYAVRAGHNQWKRDRADALMDRSREAAMSIADAVGAMHVALATWIASQPQIEDLKAAFNVFSRTVAMQSLAVSDDVLRGRVRTHQTLVGYTCSFAERGVAATAQLAEKCLANGDTLLDALSAHVHGKALPPYTPPPLQDAKSLVAWSPTAASSGAAEATSPEVARKSRQLRKTKGEAPS